MKHAFGIIVGLLCLGALLSAVNGGEKTKKVKEENGPISYIYEVLKQDQTIKHGIYLEMIGKDAIVTGSYDMNTKSGLWTYHANGHKYVEESFKNGSLDGTGKIFDEGKLIRLFNYENGLKHGIEEHFSKTNGRITSRSYYKHGNREGSYETWYENGTPAISMNYKLDKPHGDYILNYENGTNRCKLNFDNGIANGTFNVYYNSGSQMLKGEIKDGKPWSVEQYGSGEELDKEQGLREGNGTLTIYDKKDQLMNILQYKDGRLNGEQKTFRDEKLYEVVWYTDGETNGAIERYHEDGTLNIKGQCALGYKTGVWINIDEQGKVDSTTYDIDDEIGYTGIGEQGLATFKRCEHEGGPFEVVEKQPQFHGGHGALAQFLKRNVIYPKKDKEEGITGTAYVQFVINDRGEVGSVKLFPGSESRATKNMHHEAIRVIELMPRWQPAFQRGIPVSCRFMLPIEFKLR